jgi:hypothetical protein
MKSLISSLIIFLLSTSSAFSYHSDTDTQVVFKGINSNIAYTKGRQLNEASFIIDNKSNKKIQVYISKAELIRGKTATELNGLLIKDNQYPQGNSYIYLNSGTEKKVRIMFEPFTLYEGSIYTIRATIAVDGKKYVATSLFELFRQAYGDKNKFKK